MTNYTSSAWGWGGRGLLRLELKSFDEDVSPWARQGQRSVAKPNAINAVHLEAMMTVLSAYRCTLEHHAKRKQALISNV